MRKLIILLSLILIPLLLTGCYKKKKYFAPPPSPPTIEILNHHLEEEWWEYGQEWITYIKGEIKNNGNKTYTVWIAAKLFNYNDVQVGPRYDILDPVGPGEVWQFEIIYFGERIKRYIIWVNDYY